jgi:hypothetical protein
MNDRAILLTIVVGGVLYLLLLRGTWRWGERMEADTARRWKERLEKCDPADKRMLDFLRYKSLSPGNKKEVGRSISALDRLCDLVIPREDQEGVEHYRLLRLWLKEIPRGKTSMPADPLPTSVEAWAGRLSNLTSCPEFEQWLKAHQEDMK